MNTKQAVTIFLPFKDTKYGFTITGMLFVLNMFSTYLVTASNTDKVFN